MASKAGKKTIFCISKNDVFCIFRRRTLSILVLATFLRNGMTLLSFWMHICNKHGKYRFVKFLPSGHLANQIEHYNAWNTEFGLNWISVRWFMMKAKTIRANKQCFIDPVTYLNMSYYITLNDWSKIDKSFTFHKKY